MNERGRFRTACLALLLSLSISTFCLGQEPALVTVRPKDNGKALVNPDIGWGRLLWRLRDDGT